MLEDGFLAPHERHLGTSDRPSQSAMFWLLGLQPPDVLCIEYLERIHTGLRSSLLSRKLSPDSILRLALMEIPVPY